MSLQQFLLKYSEIPGAHVSAGHVTVVFDGDCMANTKENIFPVGLNKTVVAKPPNVVVCLLQYARQQMLV